MGEIRTLCWEIRTMYRENGAVERGVRDRLWKSVLCKEGIRMVHVGACAAQSGNGRGNAWGEGECALQGETNGVGEAGMNRRKELCRMREML